MWAAAGSLLAVGPAIKPAESRRGLPTQISGVEFDFARKELHRSQQINLRLIAIASQAEIEGFDRAGESEDSAIFNVDRIGEALPIECLALAGWQGSIFISHDSVPYNGLWSGPAAVLPAPRRAAFDITNIE
jgi:hypothetical protein